MILFTAISYQSIPYLPNSMSNTLAWELLSFRFIGMFPRKNLGTNKSRGNGTTRCVTEQHFKMPTQKLSKFATIVLPRGEPGN